MRSVLLPLWALVARHDRERAPTARTYITIIGIAQVGWIALVFVDLPVATTFALLVPLIVLEMSGPFVAEGKSRTPWHPHHIAERYGLLVIITLGEVILGTVAALNALVHGKTGWTVDAALLAVAGVGLTFGCWWMYFAVPWAEPLVRRPGRFSGFVFGYGHLAMFAPLAAMGAGVHVAAYWLADEAKIGATAVVLSVVIPFAVFALAYYVVYSLLMHTSDPFHLWLLAGTGAVLALAVVLAAAGVSVPVCLLVVMLAPAVTVVGYELSGHRHMSAAMQRL
jgi:low temperature requirement protein LtrA